MACQIFTTSTSAYRKYCSDFPPITIITTFGWRRYKYNGKLVKNHIKCTGLKK